MYADDIILVSDNRYNMNKMLEIVDRFGKENYIKFNPDKTMLFQLEGKPDELNQLDDRVVVEMNKTKIERVKKFRYLGCIIDESLNNKEHILERIRQARIAAASIFNQKSIDKSKVHGQVKIQQFKTYIRSILHYGLECYETERETSNALRIEEMRILKTSLKILIRTKNTLFYKTTKIQNSADRIELLKEKFKLRLLSNDYSRQLIEEIKKSAVRHENTIIDEHQNITDYQQMISYRIKYLQNKCKLELAETIQSEKLKKLLINFNENKEEIFRMLQAF